MSLQNFLSILRARSWLVILTLLMTMGATALTIYLLTPKYTAATSVVVDYKANDPFEQLGLPAQLSSGYMDTQVDIITSHTVALKVVKNLKLTDNPLAQQLFLEKSEGKGDINDDFADMLLDYVKVQPTRDSRVVQIEFVSTDPNFAATVADAFAQAYVEISLALSIEPAQRRADWFDGQLKQLRANVADTQAKLTAFQRRHEIVPTDESVDVETKRLAELTSQLVVVQGELEDIKSQQLGANHPQYQRAVQRTTALRESVEAQKQRLLQLKNQRDEIAVLSKEVEHAQQTYDASSQRYSQTNLEGRFNQTNIAVLAKAVVPTEQSSPKVALSMVLSVFLGLLLGVAFALLKEMSDRRVRSEEDLAAGLSLPLLGSV